MLRIIFITHIYQKKIIWCLQGNEKKMRSVFVENKTFEKTDFSAYELEKGEYLDCQFVDCNFSNCDLSHFEFEDCVFERCNLSQVKLGNTSLRKVDFIESKVVGVIFSEVNSFLLGLSFKDSVLNYSSFYQLPMKFTNFTDCKMNEVDFSECDLSSAVFRNCELHLAVFNFTKLENADLRTSLGYEIHPEDNKIKKCKFSKEGVEGLLRRYDIEIE